MAKNILELPKQNPSNNANLGLKSPQFWEMSIKNIKLTESYSN